MDKRRIINKCVRKSFGILYSGDWHLYGIPGLTGKDKKHPGVIARTSFLMYTPLFLIPPPYISHSNRGIGEFNADASRLMIKERVLSDAQRFQELYEKETGKRIEIQTVPDNYWFI